MAIDPTLQNKIAIGRQKALSMGYRPEQVDNYIKQKFGDVAPARPTGIGGVLKNIASTALAVPRLVAGGLYELPRALKAQRGDYSGYVDSATGATKQNPFMGERQLSKYNVQQNGLGGAATDVAKSFAGTASAVVPFAGGMKAGMLTAQVARPFVGGAVAGGLNEAAQEGSTVGSVAKAGITGGVVSKGLSMFPSLIQRMKGLGKQAGEILPEAASTIRTPTTLQTLGTKIRRGVLNPQAKATPFYAEDIQGLEKVAQKYKLAGSSAQQVEQMPEVFRRVESGIKSMLKNKPEISTKTAAADFADELTKTDFMGDKKSYKEAVSGLLKRLKTTGTKGSTTLEKLYGLKSELRNELGNTFTVVDSGTRALSPAEQSRYALWSSLKKTIDRLAPKVRGLNNDEHALFELSKGLVAQSKAGSPVKLPVVGAIPGTKEVAERTMDFAGRTLEKGIKMPKVPSQVKTLISRAASGLPNIPSGAITPASVAGGMAASSYRGTPRDQGGIPAQQLTTPTGQPESTGVQSVNIGGIEVTPQKIQRAIMLDFQSTGGKNYATLSKMLDVYERVQKMQPKTAGGVGKAAAKDVATARSGISSLAQVESMATTGKLLTKSLTPFGLGARDLQAAERDVMDAIARLRTGAAMTKNEEAFYRQYLPSALDPTDVRQQKINRLRQYFSDFANAEATSGITVDQLTQ